MSLNSYPLDTSVEHLWAKSGSVDEIKLLLQSVTANEHNISITNYSALTIARMLILYFKKMPQPLLTLELYDYFVGASYINIFENSAAQTAYLRGIIDALPPTNKKTLSKVLKVLHKVWNDGYRETRKFTLEVWGVALLLRKSVHDLDREVGTAYRLMLTLIDAFPHLFPANPTPRPEYVSLIVKKINTGKIDQMRKCLSKLKLVNTDICAIIERENLQSHGWKVGLNFLINKLSAMVLAVESRFENLSSIIDSHHLDRFFSYLLDFHTSVIKTCGEKRFVRSMTSFKLRSVYERMYLSMHYELNLFFTTLDILMPGVFRQDNTMRTCTTELILGEDAKNFWRLTFGEHSFIGCIRSFMDSLSGYSDILIDAQMAQSIKLVLDEHNSGYVTVYKFSKFINLFGPIKESLSTRLEFLSNPWFQGHLSQYEASKLLESYPPLTFLIRFSDPECNAYAINFRTENQQLFNIKVEISNTNGSRQFFVKEGSNIRRFPSPTDIIQFYSNFLKTTLKSKLPFKPWFYGDFALDEAAQFLQYEAPGTFILRFSSVPSKFTIEYINDVGEIIQCRVDRLSDERVKFNNTEYESIDHFISAYSSWFRIPYVSYNKVRATREEELIRTQEQLDQLLEDDEASIIDRNIRSLTSKPSVGKRGFTTLMMNGTRKNVTQSREQKEDSLMRILTKSASSDQLDVDEESQLVLLLYDLPQESVDKIQKKVHSKIAKKRYTSILKLKTGIRLSKYTLFPKESFIVNQAHFLELKATNHYKETVQYEIGKSYEISSRFFMAISPFQGELEAGKSIVFRVAIVLYKPFLLNEVITIRFYTDNIHHTFSIPIRVVPKKECLMNTIPMDPYWIIPNLDGKMLGMGASGMVKKCDLYGAPVAVKFWDLGKMDDPTLDFCQELEVLLSLKHENLVSFVGAIGKKGVACIALEFVAGGSLDKFLEFPSSKEINESMKDGVWKPITPKNKYNISIKLQMAIDAAHAMLYLHDNNLIHRDVKSLNFLVDPDTTNVKVADFGESAVKDSNISESVGSTPWMAPEVYNSKVYSAKADVFSFGLVLYEIFTESYPVRFNDMIAVGKIPEIVASLEEEYPEICGLIKRCCRTNCEKRPTMFNIVRDLEVIKAKYQIRKPRRGGLR